MCKRHYRNRIQRVLILAGLLLGANPAFADGFFLPIGLPRTVINTGHAELAGPIQLAFQSGVTVADLIVVDPAPDTITNAAATSLPSSS